MLVIILHIHSNRDSRQFIKLNFLFSIVEKIFKEKNEKKVGIKRFARKYNSIAQLAYSVEATTISSKNHYKVY